MNLDQDFWEDRYQTQNMGWDIGYPSTPLKAYIDQLENKEMKILIPGCGNAYEAEYLHQQGFKNVWLIDIAPSAFERLKKQVPDFPEDHLIIGDFFEHEDQYDLILEQTFFCALEPKLRPDYAKKMYDLLKPGGKLAGVLFEAELNKDHPPFGGFRDEYRKYFDPYFHFNVFERAYNSIPPRQGNELFIILEKK